MVINPPLLLYTHALQAAAAAPAAGREQRRAAHGRPGLGPSVAAAAAAEDEEEQEGSSRLRVEGGALRLTFGADEAAGRTHGLAEFIAQVWDACWFKYGYR